MEKQLYRFRNFAECFDHYFRQVQADEMELLRLKFITPLSPKFVSTCGNTLIFINDLPQLKNLEIDLYSSLYTQSNTWGIKFIENSLVRSFAGCGIKTPKAFEVRNIEIAQEFGLAAMLQHDEKLDKKDRRSEWMCQRELSYEEKING